MTQYGTEKLRELLWKEEDFLEKIVPKIKEVIKLDEKANVYFLIPYGGLTDTRKLGLYLTARFFAKQLKVVDSEHMTIKELAQKTGLKGNIATAHLNEMFNAGIVTKSKEKGKGTRYSILPHGITMIVEDVAETKSNRNGKSEG